MASSFSSSSSSSSYSFLPAFLPSPSSSSSYFLPSPPSPPLLLLVLARNVFLSTCSFFSRFSLQFLLLFSPFSLLPPLLLLLLSTCYLSLFPFLPLFHLLLLSHPRLPYVLSPYTNKLMIAHFPPLLSRNVFPSKCSFSLSSHYSSYSLLPPLPFPPPTHSLFSSSSPSFPSLVLFFSSSLFPPHLFLHQ
ncbi:unnamed protein product [Acanthosepion pharaonis]|uniref:Uncharacterized protein n=1 Tax=Acanthosepion pharaonis TaxID=158019 RepID=A0A812C7C5_ACAPH|nr:unnamed protein product [Sepia pharaonis]